MLIYETFGQQLLLNTRPARSEIKALWEKEETLQNHTLHQTVMYVNNIILKKQCIPTPTRLKIKRMVASGTMRLSP